MKKPIILKRFAQFIDAIHENLEAMSNFAEFDLEDAEMCELVDIFRDEIEKAIVENTECNTTDLNDYIEENY